LVFSVLISSTLVCCYQHFRRTCCTCFMGTSAFSRWKAAHS